MSLSYTQDDFVWALQDERATAIWVALLADGRQVFMDDTRPGEEPSSAWLRLRASGEKVVGLHLRFRSNAVHPLPVGAEGYFFSKSVARTDGLPHTLAFYIIGVLTNHKVMLQRYKVPELTLVDSFDRDEVDCGLSLIRSEVSGEAQR